MHYSQHGERLKAVLRNAADRPSAISRLADAKVLDDVLAADTFERCGVGMLLVFH